jgi:pimeloyl-ACP methyl ester carboxylesterase
LVALSALGTAAAVAVARPVACFEAAIRLGLACVGVRSRRGTVAGLDLHWLERPGRGPALVLLHGLGASAERWFPILPGLLHGRRLLVPSLPAHGRSAPPTKPFGVPDLTRWMREWLQVAGVEPPFDLLGLSMGGWVSARLALSEPSRVRRLVLASSAGVRFDPPPSPELLAPRTLAETRRLLSTLTARPLRLPGFVLRDLLRRARPERFWLVESILRGEGLLGDELDRLRVPTLVIWGAEDRLIPPAAGRELAARIPGARGVELASCGHLPYWERRREFQTLVEEFLR